MPTVERSATRRSCAWCARAIEPTEVRFRGKQVAHLACGIEHDRDRALSALLDPASSETLVSEILAEVARLDPPLAVEVRAQRKLPSTRAAKPLAGPRTEQLLRELEDKPGDRGLLEVLADHLQLVGDERGELIALDLAGSTDPAALTRRRELCIRLAPPYAVTATPVWGFGFLRKLELLVQGGSLQTQASTFAHPSCRLLEVVTLGDAHRLSLAIPDGILPRSLRTLIVRQALADESELSGLPHLQHLTVMDGRKLTSATVKSVTLSSPSEPTLTALSPEALPNVTKLRVEFHASSCITPLAAAGWFARLTELELDCCRFFEQGHDMLATALGGRKLARLAIDANTGSVVDRARLAVLCDELELRGEVRAPAPLPFVTHATFGHGRILREFDGKLEIEFASGKRTLKDGPYLKRSRD